MKKFTPQEVEQAVKASARLIQDAINDAEDMVFSLVEIGKKFKLTNEGLTVLAEANRNLLLSLIKPEEFLPALVEGGISAKDARDIAAEIKQKILDPLQAQMKAAQSEGAAPKPEQQGQPASVQKPLAPAMPLPKPKPVQIPMPSYSAPPLQSPRYVRPEGQTLDAPIAPPLSPRGAAPRPAITLGVEEPVHALSTAPAMPVRHEAVPEAGAPQAPVPTVPAVAPLAELPVGEEPAAPTPTAPTQQSAAQAPVLPAAAVPIPAQPPREMKIPPVPVRTVGVSDPYREPIDEKDR